MIDISLSFCECRSRSRRGYYDCGANADIVDRFLRAVRTHLPLLVNIET
jgi:hypothetical protein